MATRRRGHGEGSVFRRGDGLWVAVADLGYEGGRRKRKWLYAKARREVQVKLAAARRSLDDGLPLPSERQTLGQFLQRWLSDVAEPNLRPRTFIRYRELLAGHVVPSLGGRPLVKLSPLDLQALYSAKLEEGLAPRTVGHIHRALHRALQDAVRWGMSVRNICDVVKPPKVKVTEMRTLTAEQAQQLLSAAEGDPLEALFVLALTAGVREGEVLALRWEHINLETATLQIRRTVARVPGQGFVFSEPKSARSRRSISLTPMAIEALRKHRGRQLEHRVKALAWEDGDLVFPNEVGRPIEAGNLLRRCFHPLLERAGLDRVRFHDLRHSAASLMLAQGVHPKVVSEMLGHASISLTLDTYSHVLPGLQREAAAKMQAVLGG